MPGRSTLPRMESYVTTTYTQHARARLASLRIGESEVEQTLRQPIWTQPGTPGPRPSTVFVGANIRVVVEPGTRNVITVTLRTATPYVHGVHHLQNLPATLAA